MIRQTTPKLERGKIYEGVVVTNVLPNNTVSVRIAGLDIDIPCQTATSIMSGLLGFKISHLPAQKTKVLMLYMDRTLSYVLCALPAILTDPGHQARSADGPGAPNYQASQVFASRNTQNAAIAASQKPPVDLAEGEFQMDNMMGVALKLLRGMSSLSAGDLAMVECHILDDMVRIVSDTFKHHTAFGDYTINNDGGKLNIAWHGTSLDHEAWGMPRATDPKAALDPVTKQTDMRTVDGVADDGRWRFSQYIGWLGNFINVFVTDPVNAVGKIAEGQFRSGKFRTHVNNDGSFLLQSVADIVFEKVVRIPVPNPLKLANDPTGNRSNDPPKNANYLATWTPSNDGNLFEMVFQLREYARWLNNSYSLSRFYQMNLDFEVPTEAQTPVPSVNSSELDKEAINQGPANWRIAYSTIRIYRDGSYQQVDAYGNATTTTKTGYYISTAHDLYLEAGGSVNIVAGRDINLLAQQNVGITSVMQAVRIKSQTALQLLSAAGSVILDALMVKLTGSINVADGVSMINGQINATGNIYSNSTGGGVTPVPGSFSFQSDYGGSALYQSLSQQAMDNNEQTKSGVWSFSSNAVPGKGSPWPGAGANFLRSTGGTSLQTPSSANLFPSQPTAMVTSSVYLNYQS